MRKMVLACLAAAVVAGCAAAPDTTANPAASVPAPQSGATALSIIGTPFLILFKIPVCIVTVAIAAPLAGASELTGPADTDGRDLRQQLSAGVAENCGPPYVLPAS